MTELVYCPFCNTRGVEVAKHMKTVRNASHRGGAVSHVEEQLTVLGDCKNCKKTKKEIEASFDV